VRNEASVFRATPGSVEGGASQAARLTLKLASSVISDILCIVRRYFPLVDVDF